MTTILEHRHTWDVAPHFQGKVWAYVPVVSKTCSVGVAVANEPGYCPIPFGIAYFDNYEAASRACDQANREYLKLSDDAAWQIVASTMVPDNLKRSRRA